MIYVAITNHILKMIKFAYWHRKPIVHIYNVAYAFPYLFIFNCVQRDKWYSHLTFWNASWVASLCETRPTWWLRVALMFTREIGVTVARKTDPHNYRCWNKWAAKILQTSHGHGDVSKTEVGSVTLILMITAFHAKSLKYYAENQD